MFAAVEACNDLTVNVGSPSYRLSDPARGATVGTHFTRVIEALGIKDEVLQKATIAPDGVQTMRLVLDKKVDLGVSQMSEVVQADRDALVGPFPGEFDLATTFSLWYRAGVSPSRPTEFSSGVASPSHSPGRFHR